MSLKQAMNLSRDNSRKRLKYNSKQSWRHSQVVRQRSAKPPFPSSNLGAALVFSLCVNASKHATFALKNKIN